MTGPIPDDDEDNDDDDDQFIFETGSHRVALVVPELTV